MEATALGALLRPIWFVFLVRVFAFAHRSPSVYIKSLSARKPPLSDLLRPSGDEVELLAVTVLAIGLLALFEDLFLMVLKQMSAEAPGVRSNSEAVVSCLVTAPRDVDSAEFSLLGMVILPLYHLFGSDTGSNG